MSESIEQLPNLYITNFSDFMPQRGFLTSNQRTIAIADVDTSVNFQYNLIPIKENDKVFLFAENGPCKINIYQKYIDLTIKETEYLEHLYKCKSFIKNFDKNGAWEEIELNKEIIDNNLRLSFDEELFVDKKYSYIIFSKDLQSLDAKYDFRILTDKNISIKYVLEKNIEYLVDLIGKTLEKEKSSGRVYKTKNGLRIILTDKFRDLRVEEEKYSTANLMKSFYTDIYYIKAILAQSRYLCRLTPKIKNYHLLGDNSYQQILEEMKTAEIATMKIVDEIFPIKYDFNEITYKNGNRSEVIERNFILLKKLIKKYLLTPEFSVCKLLKVYNFSEPSFKKWITKINDKDDITTEQEEISKFVAYHDKWTKATIHDTTLI